MTLSECINILITLYEYYKDDLTKIEKVALNMAIEILVKLDTEDVEID